MLIGIGVASVAMAIFRPTPRVRIGSRIQAIEVAAAQVMLVEPAFRPDRHQARVYPICSATPLHVDFYPEGGAYVTWRVCFTHDGEIWGPKAFAEQDRAYSFRSGPGMFCMDPTGKVTSMAPDVIGPDGELSGVGPVGPVPPGLP
jgi:hypothetical protein